MRKIFKINNESEDGLILILNLNLFKYFIKKKLNISSIINSQSKKNDKQKYFLTKLNMVNFHSRTNFYYALLFCNKNFKNRLNKITDY